MEAEQLVGATVHQPIDAAPAPEAEVAALPARVGRFVVRSVLGRGGMGVVLSAHDPKLDRTVAIKLVSSPAGTVGRAAQGRLLGEARAMARLRHPNVVAVHEAGEHEGQVYLAMEHVEGGTLRETLAALAAPTTEEIVRLFGEAGRGLAAVHRAGLVHRDVKPDNLLVDRDGRVLVGDFGLVQARAVAPAAGASAALPVHLALTQGDEVVGTPGYMAPERWTGGVADARTDQFAFCAALYEALYGELPFVGTTRDAYRDAVVAGVVRPAAAGRAVPAWLRDVVVRGLARDPAARHASMDALLVQLGVDRRQQRLLGQVERGLALVALGTFITVNTLATSLFGLAPNYPLQYASDAGFLALVLALGWLGRRALRQTRFNRRVFGLAVAGTIVVLALTSGGQLLAIGAREVASLHLLSIGGLLVMAAVTFERRLGWIAAIYLACFYASIAWPALLFPFCLVAHLALTIGALRIFRSS